MIRKHRWLCAAMAVVLTLTGPLALLLVPAPAGAQTSQMSGMPGEKAASMEPTDLHRAGSAFVNLFYVPGKVILCAAGTVVTTLVLLGTFGSGYNAAGKVFNEGCGGDWVVTPEHISGKIPPRSDLD